MAGRSRLSEPEVYFSLQAVRQIRISRVETRERRSPATFCDTDHGGQPGSSQRPDEALEGSAGSPGTFGGLSGPTPESVQESQGSSPSNGPSFPRQRGFRGECYDPLFTRGGCSLDHCILHGAKEEVRVLGLQNLQTSGRGCLAPIFALLPAGTEVVVLGGGTRALGEKRPRAATARKEVWGKWERLYLAF